MKIGTDGVLLGAWANIAQASSILDIGTGTGLLALMAAQRHSTATITAVELDPAAQKQAQANFEQSPWSTRLQLVAHSLQAYAQQAPAKLYDSLLCNPPYYPIEQNTFIASTARRQARSSSDLDFVTLLEIAAQLLAPEGNFSLILPQQEAQQFWRAASERDWHLAQQVAVIPRAGKASNRCLLELKRLPCSTSVQELTLRPAQGTNKQYTPAFEALHRDFLLFL